jgi:NADH-quinone oxidoreductase subunit G
LRKLFLKNNLKIISVGTNSNLTYYNYHISNSRLVFTKILEGRHWICNLLSSFKKNDDIYTLFGSSSLNGFDGYDLFLSLKILEKRIGPINILNNTLSKIGALEVGFIPGLKNRSSSFNNVYNINYCLGSSDNFIHKNNKSNSIFSIYQGHHGGEFLNRNNFDVILSTPVFIEKKAHYLNIFGIFKQRTKFFPL